MFRVSVSISPRFAQNLMHISCQSHRKIIWGQVHD
jgi:hypothetical protein